MWILDTAYTPSRVWNSGDDVFCGSTQTGWDDVVAGLFQMGGGGGDGCSR